MTIGVRVSRRLGRVKVLDFRVCRCRIPVSNMPFFLNRIRYRHLLNTFKSLLLKWAKWVEHVPLSRHFRRHSGSSVQSTGSQGAAASTKNVHLSASSNIVQHQQRPTTSAHVRSSQGEERPWVCLLPRLLSLPLSYNKSWMRLRRTPIRTRVPQATRSTVAMHLRKKQLLLISSNSLFDSIDLKKLDHSHSFTCRHSVFSSSSVFCSKNV